MTEQPEDFEPTEDTSESPKPYHKSTDDEVEERTDFVREVLCTTFHKSKVKAAFREKYGEDSPPRTIEWYIARAREKAKLDHERTRSEMRQQLGEILMFVVSKARHGDIIAAAREYARLYGLNLETPPVDVIADQLGITVEQFYAVVAHHTGRTLSDTPPTGGSGSEP